MGTLSRARTFSWTYSFLTFSDFQLTCFWNNLSFILKLAAVVAPPDLRLCKPKCLDKCIQQSSRSISVLPFLIKIDIWLSFKIISKHFKLITSENLKNLIKLRAHNNVVLRFSKCILFLPDDLFNVGSSRGVKSFFRVWQQTLLISSWHNWQIHYKGLDGQLSCGNTIIAKTKLLMAG